MSSSKHKNLIFLYLTCLTLSFSPTIVAPSEKSFSLGQPEMQQAMDNMVSEEEIIKKIIEFPYRKGNGYQALLTSKTSNLLAEAEHMSNRFKNLKERRWIEAFVHRMKILSSILEKSIHLQYHTRRIAEILRIGESQEAKTNFDDHKFADFTNPNLVYNQKINKEEVNKFEITEYNMEGKDSASITNDLTENDATISETHSGVQKLENAHAEAAITPKGVKFQQLHIKLPQSSSRILASHLIQYDGQNGNIPGSTNQHYDRLDNAIHGLQHPHQQRLIMKNPIFSVPRSYVNGKQRVVTGDLGENTELSDRFPSHYYSQHYNRDIYKPYPYWHQWTFRNSTLRPSQTTIPSFLSKSSSDDQIDAAFSEEMKRQLRDGKIIVLSDSVVRFNFESKKEKDSIQKKQDIKTES